MHSVYKHTLTTLFIIFCMHCQICFSLPTNAHDDIKRNTPNQQQLAAMSKEEGFDEYKKGFKYEEGLGGVQRDLDMALIYYKLSARKGFIFAALKVAKFYDSGINGFKDIKLAREYYRRTANIAQKKVDEGNGEAMLTLAWLHEHGKGVVKDEWYAAGLYIKAARHGEYEKGMFAYARIIYPSDFNHSKLLNYHKACYIWSKLSTKGVNPNIKEKSTKLFKKNCGS